MMIQSTELAFEKIVGAQHPDWTPPNVPFPKGVGPRTYRSYVIDKRAYRDVIPLWGAHLPNHLWYYGKYGLWHPMFDPSPYYLGEFSKKFLRERYSGYYLKEILHRVYNYGDRILTESDLKIEAPELPSWASWEERVLCTPEVSDAKYMLHRVERYVRKPKEYLRLTETKFLEPYQSLEGYYRDNKSKIAKALKSDPKCHLRRETKAELTLIAKQKGLPVPVFDKRGFWINKPNPDYGKFAKRYPTLVSKGDPPVGAFTLIIRRKGRGHRLNQKLCAERRRLLSILQIPKFEVRRWHLRCLRNLERHLFNIIQLSESYARRPYNRILREDLFRLIRAVPFTTFTKGEFGTIKTLPTWARRIVCRNVYKRSAPTKFDL